MIKEKAHAKINLFLNVLGRRKDGYHDLEMVMTPLKLHDLITLKKIRDDKVELTTNIYITEDSKDNLVYKVASFIREKYNIKKGVKIHIEKNIPIAAGLAGGSTDCAATIRGMNKLFRLGLNLEEMAELGVKFGADVPFCVYSQLSIVGGIGETVEPIKAKFKADVLLVNPRIPVLTKDVFNNLDPSKFAQTNYASLIEALKNRDADTVFSNLYNHLEPTTFKLEPKVKELKDELKDFGLKGVLMSGSGSTVFVISRNKKLLMNTISELNEGYYKVLTEIL